MPIPAVLIRLSTGEIIRHANLPTLDPSEPVPGLDPDLRWLIKHTPFAAPDYDARLFILDVVEEVTETPHPTYPLYNQYRITYTTTKRDNEVILSNVKNAEQAALLRIFPTADQGKMLALLGPLILRCIEGLELTAKEEELKTRVLELGDQVWQNDTNATRIKTAIDAGHEPNLDDGWAENPATP